MPQTIEVYTFNTPNGVKIPIALEEMELEYVNRLIHIGRDEQFAPEFLKISPNNKIPAIVDPKGPDGKPISIFESGAILLYLAEKTGRLLPKDPRARLGVYEWLFWQVGGFGPMLGQAHHFRLFAPEHVPYGVERYSKEANRLYGVLNKRLEAHAFVGGDEFSVADIAIWPWARGPDHQGVDVSALTHFRRWFDAVAARPAVERGVKSLAN